MPSKRVFLSSLLITIMEFRNLLHISGKSGLFEMVGSRNNGVIARSLDDNQTQFYSSRVHQFTPLDSIEMYTTGDNVSLRKIMQNAKDMLDKHPLVAANSDNNSLKNYFKGVLPDYDEERVKTSDIKKFVKWFEYCKDLDLSEPQEETSAE